MNTDKLIDEAELRRRLAQAWAQGFSEGQQYGRRLEIYDPNRDPEDWAPEQPKNPYER